MGKIINKLKKHLVDCTALTAITTPFFCGMETGIAGMSLETSLYARLIGTGLTYAGMGSVYTWSLGKSRALFDVTEESHLNLKKLHDTLYTTSYCLAISPLFYYLSGARDVKEIAIGTAMGAALAFATGGITGYTVDAYRDFAGIGKSGRLPKFLEDQNPNMKKSFMAIGLAASMAASSLVYNATMNFASKHTPEKNKASLEKVVDSK